MDKIVVRGARVHNLANVDVDIPRDKLVVITGLSGSGKSSLAFDTIYAEGQRRYVESLSVYARQFLARLAKPDVDSIEGLSPAVAIEQRVAARNPRSTVGTITEIYDYLRLLYARIGRVHCYRCGREIDAESVQKIVDSALELPVGARFAVVAPLIRAVKGKHKRALARLRRDGYTRVTIDGRPVDLGEGVPELDARRRHDVDVYIDRLVVKEGIRQRLTDSVELAVGLADGLVRIVVVDGAASLHSQRCACVDCGIAYPEVEPRMFSFNNPHGACPTCDGVGVERSVDVDAIVPDTRLSVSQGAIAPWSGAARADHYDAILTAVCRHFAIDMDKPWRELSRAQRGIIINGHADEVEFAAGGGGRSYRRAFAGVVDNLEPGPTTFGSRANASASELDRWRDGDDDDEVRSYVHDCPCSDCGGARLRRESRHVRVGQETISAITGRTVVGARSFFAGLELAGNERAIAGRLVGEIAARLEFLVNVGLGYLTLDRPATTLSGGEAQRIRLATQIGSSLVGVLYVLDEPSIGLHPRDNDRLLAALRRLRDLGNTVLVVEHDAATIAAADYIIDMGPRAGVHGGRVMASGTVADIIAARESLTGRYLSGELAIAVPARRRVADSFVTLRGASANNLQDIDVSVAVGVMTCVTGVSGSGKSTLVMDTLRPALEQRLERGRRQRGRRAIGAHCGLEGGHHLDRIVAIDQTPIGRTPRSNPATYSGILTLVRELFAGLPESRARGYKAGRYSFNVKGGRCETCQGDGVLRIEMSFLPDVYVVCEACRGQRYNRETLEVRFKGASIADLLAMTVDQALDLLINVPKIRARLESMRDVGLGYITLGQAATTLSGGEAQRLKLSRELAKRATGRTIYILDEPTSGLHFEDIKQLLATLDMLVARGNTVVVIEHNLDVIKTADRVIDLGPGGGDDGGRVVAAGTPEEVAEVAASHTGRFLAGVL